MCWEKAALTVQWGIITSFPRRGTPYPHSLVFVPSWWQGVLGEVGCSIASTSWWHRTQVIPPFVEFQVCFQISALTRSSLVMDDRCHPSPVSPVVLELSFGEGHPPASLSLDFCLICTSVPQVGESLFTHSDLSSHPQCHWIFWLFRSISYSTFRRFRLL